MAGLFDQPEGDVVYLSRRDPTELLGTWSDHNILLDDCLWPTCEHYFQAMQFTSPDDQERVRSAIDATDAERLAKPGLLARLIRSRRRRDDWPRVRIAFMTRAIYTKCRAWPEVAEHLLQTGESRLVENSQYDYFWGCGRDLRGENRYGQVLMDVRRKLREEAASGERAADNGTDQ